jgi:hypothetical protein
MLSLLVSSGWSNAGVGEDGEVEDISVVISKFESSRVRPGVEYGEKTFERC